MTDDNRFFRYVWRFNAIVIALAAIVIIVTVGWSTLAWMLFRPALVPPPEGHFAPVPRAAEREFTYRLEATPTVAQLGNEKIFMLKRWRGEPNVYGLEDIGAPYASSGPDSGIRDVNLMAIDARDASSHWLFAGYQRAVLSVDSVYAIRPAGVPAPGEPPAPAIAIAIQVVAADTNGDGDLGPKDKQTLYVYRVGDTVAVKLLDADYFLTASQLDDARYLVVYEKGPKATAAIYSVPDFKLVSQAPLRNVPQ